MLARPAALLDAVGGVDGGVGWGRDVDVVDVDVADVAKPPVLDAGAMAAGVSSIGDGANRSFAPPLKRSTSLIAAVEVLRILQLLLLSIQFSRPVLSSSPLLLLPL